MAEEKKEKFESSYPKGVRIAAIIGVIFLVALYIVTLLAGITTSKAAPELFKMCIGPVSYTHLTLPTKWSV